VRYKKLWATGLALGLCLCVIDIAMGQDPAGGGNWFTRLFSRSGGPAAHKDEKAIAPVAASSATLRAQATADFLRRLEVCDRLREAAMETGDAELANRADLLQTRVKDAYVQRLNRAGNGVPTVDEDTLESHLAPKGGSLTPLTAGNRTKGATGQASAEGR
jgi:hypothetical protein